MRTILARIFLLLLLACDWAWDPFHGANIFTRAMASTDAVVNATPHAVRAHFRPAQQPGPDLSGQAIAVAALPRLVCGTVALGHRIPVRLGSDLIYVHMSILR
jgi:hypothetical protein